MTVKELKRLLENHDEELSVFFRCVAPVVGNIREVCEVRLSTYSFFGVETRCLILEPEGAKNVLDVLPEEEGEG